MDCNFICCFLLASFCHQHKGTHFYIPFCPSFFSDLFFFCKSVCLETESEKCWKQLGAISPSSLSTEEWAGNKSVGATVFKLKVHYHPPKYVFFKVLIQTSFCHPPDYCTFFVTLHISSNKFIFQKRESYKPEVSPPI